MSNQPVIITFDTALGEVDFIDSPHLDAMKHKFKWRIRPDLTQDELNECIKTTEKLLTEWKSKGEKMTEINISMRPEMSEEERIKELEAEVDDLTNENSSLEDEVSEQTKRADEAEEELKKASDILEKIETTIASLHFG